MRKKSKALLTNRVNTIHIIVGPTASGKSARALELAREHDGVIINCDSKQIYDAMPILTAQPSEEEVENCREEARQQYLAEERARAERERQFASSKASDEYMQCLESANWEYIHGGATPTEEDEQKCIAETKSSKDKAEAARDIVECVNQAKSGEDIERCQDEFGPL